MNLPSDQNLTINYFQNSALTYFQYGTSLEISNGIYEVNGQNKILRYPIRKAELDVKVNMNSHHVLFWSIVGRYLPNGSYVSNAYVTPSKQAKIGLALIEDNSLSVSKFKGNITNPELVGKFKEHYLYEFDYSAIQSTLDSLSIKWSRPNTSVHQRGLAIDIYSPNFSDALSVINWFKDNNPELYITNLIKQSDNILHIEFSDKILKSTSIPGSTYLLNGSFSSGVGSALSNKVDRFYDILKANGYKNLEDTGLPAHALARLPVTAKKQSYFLAKAIKEILEDSLGGQSGIVSKLVQDELEYVLGLVNGIIGAVTTLGVELDTITDGRASRLIREAIESEAIKTANSQLIKNKLITMSPIVSKDYPSILSSVSKTLHDSSMSSKENLVSLAKSNISDSFKDTKNTPKNKTIEYDNLRNTNTDSIVILGYDHYMMSEDNRLEYYENKINNSFETSIFNQTNVTLNHQLNKTVDVKCYDLSGNNVVGNVNIVDSNTVSITFTPAFTGKVIIS